MADFIKIALVHSIKKLFQAKCLKLVFAKTLCCVKIIKLSLEFNIKRNA